MGLRVLLVAAALGVTWSGNASSQAPPDPDASKPASIQLVVEGGVDPTLDNQHAIYKPGAQNDLHITSIVKNRYGQVIKEGCTPVYTIDNNIGPDNHTPRGELEGQMVRFGPATGPFSVAVHCAEDPSITSGGNGNFESSNGRFAHDKPVAPGAQGAPGQGGPGQGAPGQGGPGFAAAAPAPLPAPAPQHHETHKVRNFLLLLGAAWAVGAIVFLVAVNSGSSGGDSLYCFEITSSTCGSCAPQQKCQPTQAECQQVLQQVQGICASCSTVYAPGACSGSGRVQPIHDVDGLVASGFSRERSIGGANPVAASVPRHTHELRTGTDHATAIRWLTGGLATATFAASLWLHARAEAPSLELMPWASPDGAGLSVGGRF